MPFAHLVNINFNGILQKYVHIYSSNDFIVEMIQDIWVHIFFSDQYLCFTYTITVHLTS